MNAVAQILHGSCALVLLAAAGSHLRYLPAQRRALATHGVLPRVLHWPATLGLLAAEAVLGMLLLVAVVVGDVTVARWAGTATAVLFTGFAAYLYAVWRVRAARGGAAVPCACGVGETEVGGWVVARAALFAGLAAVGTAAADAAPPAALTDRTAPELAVVVAGALTFAVVITLLPVARRVPDDLTLTVAPATPSTWHTREGG